MYTISDTINTRSFQGLQVAKIMDLNAREIIQVHLEADAIFPTHTSPTDAYILVLEGEINFYINSDKFILKKHQFFDFPKKEEHWVEATKNSIFLIIR
ncbi:MAG: cupin domain-containing protein [Bacteroidia bacterium]|nr:cupin domain-containing protein [Bacteroidia bacterium]NND52145.1 cupin domain-containing protein [Flavobacteriaceae bacterium]